MIKGDQPPRNPKISTNLYESLQFCGLFGLGSKICKNVSNGNLFKSFKSWRCYWCWFYVNWCSTRLQSEFELQSLSLTSFLRQTTKLDHRVHETVQKTTTRVDEGASVLYKVHCETISEKSGHASYFKSTQPISVVTNLLYIILGICKDSRDKLHNKNNHIFWNPSPQQNMEFLHFT